MKNSEVHDFDGGVKEESEKATRANSKIGELVWAKCVDFTYGLLFTLSSVAFTMALPIVVDRIRNSYDRTHPVDSLPRTQSQSAEQDRNYSDRDVMF